MLRKSQDGDTDQLIIFRVKISLLHNYRVKYYIVKCCSGIACDWCASLDIAYILALTACMNPDCDCLTDVIGVSV